MAHPVLLKHYIHERAIESCIKICLGYLYSGNGFDVPCDVIGLLRKEAEFFDVSLNLGFQFREVLGAAALHLLVVIEQDVRNVLVMLALLVMCLK